MASNDPRILVVDDDPDTLEIHRHVLEGHGFRVEGFVDPQDAWESLTREAPVLIVSDLMMRTLDSGFSLAQAVRSDPRFRGIPIILVTAIGSKQGFDFRPRGDDDLAAMSIDAFFDKPADPAALVAKVRELLARAGGEGRP